MISLITEQTKVKQCHCSQSGYMFFVPLSRWSETILTMNFKFLYIVYWLRMIRYSSPIGINFFASRYLPFLKFAFSHELINFPPPLIKPLSWLSAPSSRSNFRTHFIIGCCSKKAKRMNCLEGEGGTKIYFLQNLICLLDSFSMCLFPQLRVKLGGW